MSKKIISTMGGEGVGLPRGPRISNWSPYEDEVLVGVFRKQFDLGNMPHGSFYNLNWLDVLTSFNKKTRKAHNKQELFNRMKILKRRWASYAKLVAKTGWGWDPDANIPVPRDVSECNEIDAQEDVREKPFVHYLNLDWMFRKSNSREGNCSVGSSYPSPDKGLIEKLNIDNIEKVVSFFTEVGLGSDSSGKRSFVGCTTSTTKKGKKASQSPEFNMLDVQEKNSVEQVFKLLAELGDIDPEPYLVSIDTLKDRFNRLCFINMKPELRLTWLEKEAWTRADYKSTTQGHSVQPPVMVLLRASLTSAPTPQNSPPNELP